MTDERYDRSQLDIFKKDLILVPINQGNSHWSCAVINFRCKRIEAYDSMDRAGGANFVFKVRPFLPRSLTFVPFH